MKDNFKMVTGFIAENEIEELVDAKTTAVGGEVSTIAITTLITAASAALQSACPTSGCTKKCINHD